MNLGTIYLDLCEPISFTDFNKKALALNPKLDPFMQDKDKLQITNDLGLKIIYDMQRQVRMMPTTLASSMLLLHRRGISEEELEKRVKWLG